MERRELEKIRTQKSHDGRGDLCACGGGVRLRAETRSRPDRHAPRHLSPPPLVMLPLSDRDSRYFKGIPVLFEDGSFKSLKPILKARLALPHLTDAVRDRLRFDLALVDLRLKDAASRLEAEDLLIRLDAFGAPYEIREASGIILSFWKESRHERRANAELKKKLEQVKKTFRELSTLENSLR